MPCTRVGHVSNTPRTPCQTRFCGVQFFKFFWGAWTHRGHFSKQLDMHRTLLWTHSGHFSDFFFIKILKNQPKRLDYKKFFLKLAYFDKLFHVAFCLLLFYSHLRFAPFVRHHPFTFLSTPVTGYFPLIIASSKSGRLAWLTSRSWSLYSSLHFVSLCSCIFGTPFVRLI